MNKEFKIQRPSKVLLDSINDKIDNLAKPKGSLGRLEDIARKVCLIQERLNPEFNHPCNVLFGGDHGIVKEGVTSSPKEVTYQQMINFVKGGAGINFLCRQHDVELVIVDAGVDYVFPDNSGIKDRKVGYGTKNFLVEAAMNEEELDKCVEYGALAVDEIIAEGSNVVSFGEMGSGNTSASSVWMHLLTGIPLETCVGRGANNDADEKWINRKISILETSIIRHKDSLYNGKEVKPEAVMRYFGGFEMVMAVGAMLRAAERKMTIIIDGFIMTACVLMASKFYPEVLDYCIFGHCGDEQGHKKLLDYLEVEPVLNLSLRLGEGSGAVCAYPIILSAVKMINEMSSFKNASITKYF